ncbi:hypothetical protein NliqN6_2544 [Naganishia liquefaciens]|uniref:SCP2 domain-containing protein n=1 Tax=Naganishia liquefaciens TaxID=104408 RepID=A0A8H3YFE6_9TREE|nr:hypothetical protein NliqN6_2544 [Naganishia liquefaciens]
MSRPNAHHAPPAVETHAQEALETYPDLRVPGLENASQVFALVAESLGQKPPAFHVDGSKNANSDRPAAKTAAVQNATGPTYQPQGLPQGEKSAKRVVKRGRSQRIDARSAEKRRKDWVRRLGAVFDFEVTPTASSSSDGDHYPPNHFFIDLFSTGRITLQPPAILTKHSKDPGAPNAWSRRHLITINISDRDLLAVAIGERVPVKLFSEGRLKVKGDIHKALLLGKLLSVTRSQIYADADAESPPHDLYSARPSIKVSTAAGHAEAASKGGDLEGDGMQGTGAPAGGAEWGVGAMKNVRAKL